MSKLHELIKVASDYDDGLFPSLEDRLELMEQFSPLTQDDKIRAEMRLGGWLISKRNENPNFRLTDDEDEIEYEEEVRFHGLEQFNILTEYWLNDLIGILGGARPITADTYDNETGLMTLYPFSEGDRLATSTEVTDEKSFQYYKHIPYNGYLYLLEDGYYLIKDGTPVPTLTLVLKRDEPINKFLEYFQDYLPKYQRRLKEDKFSLVIGYKAYKLHLSQINLDLSQYVFRDEYRAKEFSRYYLQESLTEKRRNDEEYVGTSLCLDRGVYSKMYFIEDRDMKTFKENLPPKLLNYILSNPSGELSCINLKMSVEIREELGNPSIEELLLLSLDGYELDKKDINLESLEDVINQWYLTPEGVSFVANYWGVHFPLVNLPTHNFQREVNLIDRTWFYRNARELDLGELAKIRFLGLLEQKDAEQIEWSKLIDYWRSVLY